jgi:serine/threonine protein kinase
VLVSHNSNSCALAPGTRVGRYELVQRIGRGGMGEVWKGRHLTLGAPVAIKFELNGAETERFVQEGRVAASLSSSHICRVLEEGTYEGRAYLVMEFLEGETLGERLLSEGRIAPAELTRIVADVALGLACAHAAGIVHRDLKPSNIFLLRDGLTKVLDFGVARVEGADHTSSGQFLGTLRYVSPEQARDARKVTARSDLWSLGVIVFECVVGKRLFQGESLPEILDAIYHRDLPRPSDLGPASAEFDAWFMRVMQRDPQLRPPSVEDFARTLHDALLYPQASAIARPGRFESPGITVTKHQALPPRASTGVSRAAFRRGGLVAAIAVLGVGSVVWQGSRGDPEPLYSDVVYPTAARGNELEVTSYPRVAPSTSSPQVVAPTSAPQPAASRPTTAPRRPTSKPATNPPRAAPVSVPTASNSARQATTLGGNEGEASAQSPAAPDFYGYR